MPLHIIGLGLNDEKDITVRGLETIKRCAKVYLEGYTSILLGASIETLRALYQRPVFLLDRTAVEQQCEQQMLEEARTADIAFAVVGDALCATTHSDLLLRAAELGVQTTVVHNASVMTAVAACGLQLYRFGETVSIPFFDGAWRPASFLEKIRANRNADLHTLCLLDIKVKEQTAENLMKGNNVFEPPRYMSVQTAVSQILEILEAEKSEEKAGAKAVENTEEMLRGQTKLNTAPDDKHCVSGNTLAFGVARLGSASQLIVSGTLDEFLTVDLGAPLHSLVICASTLHSLERAFFDMHRKNHVASSCEAMPP